MVSTDYSPHRHTANLCKLPLSVLLYCRLSTVTYNSNLADLIVLWESGEFGPLLLQSFIIQQSFEFSGLKIANFWQKIQWSRFIMVDEFFLDQNLWVSIIKAMTFSIVEKYLSQSSIVICCGTDNFIDGSFYSAILFFKSD